MKDLLRNTLLLFLLVLLVKCDDEEVTSRDYPRLKTLPASEITSEDVRFNGEIIFRGDFEIINYGFAWGRVNFPNTETNDHVSTAENIKSNQFSETVTIDLKEGATYFVRAFVETNDLTVYGESISFTKP